MTLLFLGGGLYSWGWRALKRRMTIMHIPTSKARSVAMGLAEVQGKAKPVLKPRPSPVSGLSSVWNRVRVTRETGSGKNRHVKVLLDREMRESFYIEDATGRVLVNPDKAEVSGVLVTDLAFTKLLNPPDNVAKFCDMNGIAWRFEYGTIKIREWVILADADTYVLGEAARLTDSAMQRRQGIAERLKAWLKDPARKAQLDLNKDGIIAPDEWDKARETATDEQLREEVTQPPPEAIIVMRKPRFGFFLVASGTEKEALAAQGYPAILLAGGIALLGFGVWLLPMGEWQQPQVWIPAAIAGLMMLLSGAGLLRKMKG